MRLVNITKKSDGLASSRPVRICAPFVDPKWISEQLSLINKMKCASYDLDRMRRAPNSPPRPVRNNQAAAGNGTGIKSAVAEI